MTKRMKLSLLLLLLLLLAACDASVPYADPNLAAQDAKATIGAATAIAQSTQDEQRRVEREATREAARTQEASQAQIAVMEASIRTTDAAASIERTSTAIAWGMEARRAEATERAEGTATAFVRTATPAAATQVAIDNAIRLEQQKADIKNWETKAWTIALPVISLVFSIAAAIIAVRFFSSRIRTNDGLARLIDKKQGLVLLHPNDPKAYDWDAEIVIPHYPDLGAVKGYPRLLPDNVTALNASETVLSSPMKKAKISPRWAIDLLYDSIALVGEKATEFPGRDDLGWGGWRWDKGIDYWEAVGVADPTRGAKKKLINEKYPTLGDLAWAIESHEFKITYPVMSSV